MAIYITTVNVFVNIYKEKKAQNKISKSGIFVDNISAIICYVFIFSQTDCNCVHKGCNSMPFDDAYIYVHSVINNNENFVKVTLTALWSEKKTHI